MKTAKEEILLKARVLLMQPNQNEYTLDTLALELKKSKKTIYKYFQSKTELLDEVFNKHNDYLVTRFENLMSDDESHITRVILCLDLIRRSSEEIRLSKWYYQTLKSQNSDYNHIEFLFQVYRKYLSQFLDPYEIYLTAFGKQKEEFIEFILNGFEMFCFKSKKSMYKVQNLEYLIFSTHVCLMKLEDIKYK